MQATEKKRTRAVRRRGMVFLRLVLSVLGVGAVVVLSAKAWLAINDAVKSDMDDPLYSQTILLELSEGVDANGEYLFDASGGPVRLTLDKPGSTETYTVKVKNSGNCDLDIVSFGLLAPADGEEIPITTADGKFYLGTQIAAALSRVNGEPFSGTSSGALVSSSDETLIYDGDTSVNFISGTTVSLDNGNLIAGDIELLSTSAADGDSKNRIAPGETIEFTVTFTFVETNGNQNDYRDFSKHDGVCSRRFFAECEAADSEPDIPEISNP